MLDFIVNNAVWFILALVLIVLVVIGYYVDKQGFNTKKTEVEKDNQEKEEELKEIKRKAKKEIIDMDIPFIPVDEKKEDTNTSNDTMKAPGIATLGDYLSKQNEETPVNTSVNMGGEDLNAPFGDQPVKPNPMPNINEDLNAPFGDQPVKPQPVQSQPDTPQAQPQPKDEDIWNV